MNSVQNIYNYTDQTGWERTVTSGDQFPLTAPQVIKNFSEIS